jgi:hypothetical protein
MGATDFMAPAPAESAQTFISYAREDSDFALKLVRDLRKAGAHIWFDRIDIPVGKNWPRAVEEALNRCGRFLVILSPASVGSDNVMAELNFALDEGKQILPVLYRDCKRPFRVRAAQYADFTSEYQAGLSTLLETLISGPAIEAAASPREASLDPPRLVPVAGQAIGHIEAKLDQAPEHAIGNATTYPVPQGTAPVDPAVAPAAGPDCGWRLSKAGQEAASPASRGQAAGRVVVSHAVTCERMRTPAAGAWRVGSSRLSGCPTYAG